MTINSNWAYLPDYLLEEIFVLLPMKNLGRCSQVCINWYRIAQSQYVWQNFEYRDHVLTRRKYTSHSGWQYSIDHWKLRLLVLNTVTKWRRLRIKPVTILFNLYEFIRAITAFAEFEERNFNRKPLSRIHKFTFEWSFLVHGMDEHNQQIFGTGGEMLKTVSLFLQHLHGLKFLTLLELQLEPHECNDFINDILLKFQEQLISLCVINVTKIARPFMQFGLFLNLRRLVISPQHIDKTVLLLIADLKNLESLTIYQNEKNSNAKVIDAETWRTFAERNKMIKVKLLQSGRPKDDLIIQPMAPVRAIIFENSNGQLTEKFVDQICCNYSSTLNLIIYKGLERKYRSRKFKQRIDSLLLELVLHCTQLKVLAVRERMSYGTAVLLAALAVQRGLQIYLRRNALLKRISWSRRDVYNLFGMNLMDFDVLKASCRNLETVEQTIRNMTNCSASIMSDNRYLHSF